ncbi:KICSTOR complex protein kaptin-like [Lineus longissimus]|uniref:KICSTOR complex protein kaptin-like n=1 Tax=Lineus longissimus TaxID=88925 RepID=UPI002B4F52C0
MSLSCNLREAHFHNLHSQSNVYGLAKICLRNDVNKLLIATLRGKVMSMEYHRQFSRITAREVHFTYIPGDAEIVSIDAFSRSQQSNAVVVGITFVKNSNNKPSQFLNIYSDSEPDAEFNLENIAQGCFNLELNFIPFQLCHTDLIVDGNRETVFLLSGSDCRVHMYREDKVLHIFNQQPSERIFPEFCDLPSPVIWIEIKHIDEYKRRLTAMGCQSGYVKLVLVKVESREVLQTWAVQHDGPVTSVRLFSLTTDVPVPNFIQSGHSDQESVDEEVTESEPEKKTTYDYNLLVTGALEISVVYRDVLKSGLSDQMVLGESADYDSVLCSCITDIDFDGENEILLGTYGQELLVYKHHPKPPTPQDCSPEADKTPDTQMKSRLGGQYYLDWQRSFSYPLLAMNKLDITHDGLNEVAVVSLNGLHVLQHNLEAVSKLCLERMKELTRERTKEDAFQQLQSENLDTENDT